MKFRQWMLACVLAGSVGSAWAQGTGVSNSAYLEDLTWPEVAARMTTGTNSIIIPTGGTEQNGPHIAIGKHNWIVGYTSGEIARQLGNALAAPVMAYVPEGSVNPAQGHMLFPGTISISDKVFAGVLEDTARSFKQHGFKYIFFLGDSGPNQEMQVSVAQKLSKEWKADGVVVASLDAYYADVDGANWAKAKKLGGEDPQAHAGFMDASETLAVHKDGVRADKIMPYYAKDAAATGAVGDPSGASVENGRALLALKVAAGVKQIRAITGAK
jgi:creatinine amidohydrolase/Fe(II)-dependent formamide hydrolase-like protein